MKKRILIGVLSLCLLAAPLSTMEVQAATQAQGTTEFYLPKYKENTGRPGRHIRQDRRQYRAWELADAGFRFRNPPPAPYGIKKESGGGKWGGIIPGKKKVQSVISA